MFVLSILLNERCIYMAKWTATSSKGIGATLSWFLMNTLLLRTFVLMDDLREFRYSA